MLTFAYPWFLWGLLALAGPLVLHLLNRRRPRQLVFPSIRFLRRSQLPREGRRRLRDLLLLLLRLLLIRLSVLVLMLLLLLTCLLPFLWVLNIKT